MTDDVLEPWLRAYRDENPGEALDAGAIRDRVLVGVGRRQRRKLAFLRFALPVAATFLGSVALAASHSRLPSLDDLHQWLGVGVTEAPAKGSEPPRRAAARVAHRVTPAPNPVVPLAAAEVETPEKPAFGSSRDELPVKRSKKSATSPSKEPTREAKTEPKPEPKPEPKLDPLKVDLAAYQEAHRLHFHGGDPSVTLARWDAYLASHPAGTFAPEARFNRAICLLRLGRRSEARAALVPIAESGVKMYGRNRARSLLDAME